MKNLILNVGYKSTNYWVIGNSPSRLLFDIGWPGTMGKLKANLKRMDIPIKEIKFAIASHYHIDHAGLAEEIKKEGICLLVIDLQVNAIGEMKKFTKPADRYIEVTLAGNTKVIQAKESRKLLEYCMILGEVVPTEGHSDDGVSLLLDDGSVFTGDLPPEEFSENDKKALHSWQILRERGAKVIYPAHGPIRAMKKKEKPY